jgi:hypothetical protein
MEDLMDSLTTPQFRGKIMAEGISASVYSKTREGLSNFNNNCNCPSSNSFNNNKGRSYNRMQGREQAQLKINKKVKPSDPQEDLEPEPKTMEISVCPEPVQVVLVVKYLAEEVVLSPQAVWLTQRKNEPLPGHL